MKNLLWGPFHLLPNCRLWLAEDRIGKNAEVSELRESLAEARLSDRDLYRWDRYRPLEKKRQFLSSRLAIREILKREFGTDSENLVVNSIESGQPILEDCRRHTLAKISLSHSGTLTAIALGENHFGLGVDIEVVQPFNARALSLSFINQFEHDWLTREALFENPDVTLGIWTLKEAVWKALGGPKDTSFAEITIEYRDSTLNPHVRGINGKKIPASAHLFGQRYSFPRGLKNYSITDGPDSQNSAFMGCLVVVDPPFADSED